MNLRDYDFFWEWCRNKTKEGHKVFISEYNAPEDFKCIWEKESSNNMSVNHTGHIMKKVIERLFIYNR